MSGGEKIIVGMSGGVDSSVAAYLLLRQGYRVEGLFMKNWEEDDTEEYCSASVDLEDARQVCDRLDIPLHTVNFSGEYWDHVFEFFLHEYRVGRTPNPDIMCNREIKFKAFLDHAQVLGARRIATGHYVRLRQRGNRFELLRGLDANKDQSYFLYALDQYQIGHALFPLGELDKPKVRDIARQQDFTVHAKKDSTGICFIGERKFRDFLQRYIPAQPGEIVTVEGQPIGSHSGLMYYTIGQRKGLGIGGTETASEEPWYVIEKRLDSNQLVVAQGIDHPLLFHSRCAITDLHWISQQISEAGFVCSAKIRYRQQDSACRLLEVDERSAVVEFKRPQRAITPGQALVFYQAEQCLGGGVIDSAFNP
ncbi:MAG: tRNA 2-thiouridine(34) synthase MnmA [Gammaproteobacteria bacterium]|nr:tRNA 2-thiouridine(34) synthase MnmA [Gammaproteobacteria bacterium]MDH3447478.1 tRNA 2-thiouridine(34) synthase MnmA [Gammaproteobacteria bacterium]